MFPFFQSLGTLPDCHDFSNVAETVWATSASSLRTLGCISSDPMTCDYSLSSRGPTPVVSLQWKEFCSPNSHLEVQVLETWETWLPEKTEVKNSTSTPAFSISISVITSCPFSLIVWVYSFILLGFSLGFLFLTHEFRDSFLIILHIPYQVPFQSP